MLIYQNVSECVGMSQQLLRCHKAVVYPYLVPAGCFNLVCSEKLPKFFFFLNKTKAN